MGAGRRPAGARSAAQVVVAPLRRLGYRSALRVIPNEALPEAFPRLFDSRSRTQAYVFPWVADHPAPSNFTEALLSCAAFAPATPDNMNGSQFCSPAIDRMMRAAASAQAMDPARADRLWTRVGGYRYHPMRGILLDQLWVR